MRKLLIPFIAVFMLLASCEKVAEIIQPKDARETYLSQIELTSTADSLRFIEWQIQWDSSLLSSLSPSLPYRERGVHSIKRPSSAAYALELRLGEIFHLEYVSDSINEPVFYELFRLDSLDWKPIWSNDPGQRTTIYEVEQDGQYLLRWQSSLEASDTYEWKLWRQPVYAFPVSGKGNADIWSVWGDPRDGGKRKHKGIDIFAKRGVPVVAITDGVINSSRNGGRGGEQVWLRDPERGNLLYYAHLDKRYVQEGDRVKLGDTLGVVGNTGNASRTRSHLHFGIYRSRRGAVDPQPFVYRRQAKFTEPAVVLIDRYEKAETSRNKATLRKGPHKKAPILEQLSKNTPLSILAIAGNWYRVQTSGGQHGYIYKNLVRTIAQPAT